MSFLRFKDENIEHTLQQEHLREANIQRVKHDITVILSKDEQLAHQCKDVNKRIGTKSEEIIKLTQEIFKAKKQKKADPKKVQALTQKREALEQERTKLWSELQEINTKRDGELPELLSDFKKLSDLLAKEGRLDEETARNIASRVEFFKQRFS